MKVLVQVALIADPDEAGKSDILRTSQLRQDQAQNLANQRQSKIIVVPPGVWLDTIKLCYIPKDVVDDLPQWQVRDLESNNYYIVYWRGKFLQISAENCYIPLTINWTPNH